MKYLMFKSTYPIPVPIRNEIRLVITRVYITSLEKIDFFVIFPFILLSLEDSELFLLLHEFDGNFHSLKNQMNYETPFKIGMS